MYKVIDNVKILMTAEELAELEAMGQAQPRNGSPRWRRPCWS